MTAENSGDYDKLFNELAAPGLRVESRAGTIFPERTPAELRDSVEPFHAMVASARTWYSVVRWLSPTVPSCVRNAEAIGEEGEHYEWSHIYVAEFERGLYTGICDFDVEFEAQAFAYAEERLRAAQSPLLLSNQASEAGTALTAALAAADVDAALALYSISSSMPIVGGSVGRWSMTFPRCRRASGLLLVYSQAEEVTLAVRGNKFALGSVRIADDRGNFIHNLEVLEVGEDGRIVFMRPTMKMTSTPPTVNSKPAITRAKAHSSAECGLFAAEYVATMNRGDFDTMFNELSSPGFRFENRGDPLSRIVRHANFGPVSRIFTHGSPR